MFESRGSNSRLGHFLGYLLFTPYRGRIRRTAPRLPGLPRSAADAVRRADARLHVRAPIPATAASSYLKLPRALAWAVGNVNYHHVHHLSARIPNHRLRAAHEEQSIFARTPVATIRSGIAALRLKLWDEEHNRSFAIRFAASACLVIREPGESRSSPADCSTERTCRRDDLDPRPQATPAGRANAGRRHPSTIRQGGATPDEPDVGSARR